MLETEHTQYRTVSGLHGASVLWGSEKPELVTLKSRKNVLQGWASPAVLSWAHSQWHLNRDPKVRQVRFLCVSPNTLPLSSPFCGFCLFVCSVV